MKKNIFTMLALLCTMVQGAWAQTEVATESELRSAITDGANIRLTADITVASHLTIPASSTVTIVLDGNTLRGNGEALDGSDGSFSCIFIVAATGELILSNGTLADADNSATSNADHSAGAIVNKGTATLTGVTIQNCKGYNGGAINNHAGATLTINSVTFTGNTADYCGGAIYNKGTLNFNSGSVNGSTAPYGGAIYNTGSFTMADGTISNCQSTTGGGGGIVNIGTVEISGGTFSGNTSATDGGAIWNGNSGSAHGTLTITGGTITTNTAKNYGGGIWNESTVNMKGKVIVNNNTVSSSANNVYLNGTSLITCSGAFTSGANIGISLEKYNRSFTSGYKTQNSSTAPGTYFQADNNGATLSLDGNEVSLDTQYTPVSDEDELRSAITNGANIKLTADISIGSTLEISGNKTVTINLAGHTLNRGCTSRGSQVIGVRSGSTLYLSNGTVTGGWGGGGGAMFNEGTMHLTSVTISGNTADDRGGGISNNGTLTMTGCTVSNNTSLDATSPAGGGGIFNYEGKTATLTNCTITGNTTNTYGGGGICNYGTMTLNNCSVKNNSANTTGGGFFCSTTSTLSINGCTITGNVAGGYGDGIYIDNSTLNMQGLCTVTGNTDSNIYLYGSSTVITVTGAFTTGSNIGLGSTDYGRKLTSGYSTYNSGTDPGNFFSSDNYKYAIGEKDGEAYPGAYYTERSWEGGNTDGHVASTQKLCTNYKTYSSTTDDKTLNGGWYVLSGSFTFNNRVKLNGNVNFILLDGCNVEFDNGIQIPKGWTLTIYAQSDGDSKGYLRADGSEGENAAIGAEGASMGGKLVIHGGKVYAKPDGNNAAGIGGGNYSSSGMQSVTIYGGNVTAEGKSSGPGIGGGQNNASGHYVNVTIYGGTVTANGGNYAAGIGGGENCGNGTIKIYGGTVTATGKKNGAGIGGGEDSNQNNPIYIYGGNVTATGGSGGAGIGGGGANSSDAKGSCNGGTVTIYGGTVNATGGSSAAGIGGGYRFTSTGTGGTGGTVTIYDGTVNATGGTTGAGIGGGVFADGGTVTVNGGTVTATGGDYAAGIGGGKGGNGGTVNINGGTVTAAGSSATVSESSEAHAIGHGCSVTNDGSLTLGSTIQVRGGGTDGGLVSKDSRVSYLKTKGTRTAMVCDHEGCSSFSQNGDYYHHYDCSYCEGEDELHTKGNDGNCTTCGKGLPQRTYTFYEANADGTGYGEGTAYYVTETHAFIFPDCNDVPSKMSFAGWQLSDNAPGSLVVDNTEDLIAAGSTITVPELSSDRNYYARYKRSWNGSGTGADPYQIDNEEDWNMLTTNVSNGTTYSGKYFQLTNDISVDEMVGSSSTMFSGTFDGDGHTLSVSYTTTEEYTAPFRYVDGATIRNLKVSGTITTSAKFAAGMIGWSQGTVSITNGTVDVTINSQVNGDGTHAGIVSNISNGTTTISGCVFCGSLQGSNTHSVGGFVGWTEGNNSAKANITDCLFTPESMAIGTQSSYTFARYRNETDISINNSYYTYAFATRQGVYAYTVISGTDGLTLDYGTGTNYGDIQAYSFGLLYQDVLYSTTGKTVTFSTVTAEDKVATGMTASQGSLTGDAENGYTLVMADFNSIITATIEDKTFTALTLYDGTHTPTNTTTIEDENGKYYNVTIDGRTLYKDGSWNTLCLPFDVNADKISVHPQLQGCTIMELDVENKWIMDNGQWIIENEHGTYQTGFKDGTLYLFFQTVTEIDARRPYLIRWNRPDNYEAYNGKTGSESNASTCSDVVNPVFYGSYVESDSPRTVTSTDGKVSFIGNFDPVTLTGGDKSVLYLGADNQLYYPAEDHDRTINAFRAYFTVDLSDAPAGVRTFVLNLGEEETTGVALIDNGKLIMDNSAEANSSLFTLHSSLSGWYDLQGRRVECSMFNVQRSMLKKGVYIVNDKKVVIK